MHLIPDWQPLVVNGELQLRREFVFRNFKEGWRSPTASENWRRRSSIIRRSCLNGAR